MDAFLPTDETGFERLLLEAMPRVRRRLGGQTVDGHELDDVLQDAVARALVYRSSFDPARGSLVAWLSRVAQRVLEDRQVRRGRAPEALGFEPLQVERGDAATREELVRAMGVLGNKEREILLRFHARDESVAEIGGALELPEGTVKSHLHRARRRLAQELVTRGFGPALSENTKKGDDS